MEFYKKKHTKNFAIYKGILDQYSLDYLAKQCDVSLRQLEALAELYATNKPASIILGWGLQRWRKGHLTFRYIDALAAITGNIGIPGGGVSQGFDEYGFFDRRWEGEELANHQRKLPMPTIGDAILRCEDPPIKLIFVTAGNPVNMAPNSNKVKKAFEETDFVIVVDQFLNDTAELADLFLPSTTFLEEEDLVGSYGHNWISSVNPAIPPIGESKSELEIFQLLANKLGIGDKLRGTPKEWLRRLAAPIINQGISFKKLQAGPCRVPSAPMVPFSDYKFKTKFGKFEFVTDNVPEKTNDSQFPYHLLSTMSQGWIGSEIPSIKQKNGILEVYIHPKVAKKEQITDGEKILLESPVGQLLVTVKISDKVRPDVILTYRGKWMKYQQGINILTLDIMSDSGYGTPYYETRVRLKKLLDN